MFNTRLIYILSVISLCIFLSACNNTVPAKEIASQKIVVPVIKSDTAQVQSTIIDFLSWYRLNLKKANAFPILTKDSSGIFVVNRLAYTDYLNLINSSNLVSSKYIGYWQVYFKDKETQLKSDQIKTGTPEGFDFDFILITQHPAIILDQIKTFKYNIVSMSDSVALVGMKLPSDSSVEYEFEMYKEKQAWKIGYISTPNYD